MDEPPPFSQKGAWRPIQDNFEWLAAKTSGKSANENQNRSAEILILGEAFAGPFFRGSLKRKTWCKSAWAEHALMVNFFRHNFQNLSKY